GEEALSRPDRRWWCDADRATATGTGAAAPGAGVRGRDGLVGAQVSAGGGPCAALVGDQRAAHGAAQSAGDVDADGSTAGPRPLPRVRDAEARLRPRRLRPLGLALLPDRDAGLADRRFGRPG